jgi:hypothetical protein
MITSEEIKDRKLLESGIFEDLLVILKLEGNEEGLYTHLSHTTI